MAGLALYPAPIFDLGGIRVFESTVLHPGQVIAIPEGVAMHPLDLIAMTHPQPYDRLDAAMAWLLRRTLAQLDAIAPHTKEATHG